jgi:ketosteroid isomerase-like protein
MDRDREARRRLVAAMARFDETFAADRGTELGNLFTADARLMWPELEDIAGREAIRTALESFVAAYTTLSWQPDRGQPDICGDRAYTIGRFVEIRRPRDGGPTEKVYGRLVEQWRRDESGEWLLASVMTSRYAPAERVPGDEGG